jgi:hypothetical protein
MRRVIAVVEGITEQRFVDNVLATRLAAHGVFVHRDNDECPLLRAPNGRACRMRLS